MESKDRPRYRLQDLIDMAHFQDLQDKLNEIYSFPSAIIDNDGNILTATAWQDVCTKFYRAHPEGEKECLKSDRYILSHLGEANPAVSYKCPHGLVDNATPIIVDGVHYGNFFTGQFFLAEPDLSFYEEQARLYGFDREAFLSAVRRVPIWSAEQLNNYLFFINGLIAIISESALKNLRDIESHKRIELGEMRMRAAIETTNDGFWTVGMDGRILDANETYARMSGYSIEELRNLNVSDLEAIESPDAVAAHIGNVAAKGVSLFESRHRRKDGTFFDVEVSVTYLPGENEQIICFCRDITQRKRIEEELKEKERRLELAASSAELGIWDWDITNDKMVWNDQMFRLYGIAEKPTSYGIDIWKRGLHPDDIELAWNACQAAIRDEKKYDIEFRVRHPDGEVRFIKADGLVLRDPGGRATRMIGINRDVTDRKNADDEHRRYEQRLQQTQKLESLGVLAGGIAHDFNNLLGGIYGYVDLASRATEEERRSRYLAKAASTIERARGLTQQLLTFAKGGAPIKKVESLFPFARETVEFALSGSNVSCRFDAQEGLASSSFDRGQIGQVIDNIVINAKQAMPDGGSIEVRARNVRVAANERPPLAQGDYVEISIRDEGIGIPEDILPRIFDPFFTTKASGHGLGLASCYSIVKKHEGRIEVESRPGEGSVFRILLPAATRAAPSPAGEAPRRHMGFGTFVVMDDEEVMRETICGMLESFGYLAIGEKDGDDAIAFVLSEVRAHREIAGMVFDLTVPGGMGGIETLQKVKELCPATPVFVTSGYAEDPVMADPRGYGFTASLRKPFTEEELSRFLNDFIDSPA